MGLAGFATMQPVLVLQAVPLEMRGRALGAIALGIGVSPPGLILVGYLAEAMGPQEALALVTGLGFLAVLGLRWRYPELRSG